MENVMEAIEVAKATGKIRKGVNEVTKAVERGQASLVAIATDASPKELIMHLPILCEEKSISCMQDVGSKEELGAAAGIARPTVCVAITNPGDAKDMVSDMGKAKAAPKEEAPAEEPVAEDKAEEAEATVEEKE